MFRYVDRFVPKVTDALCRLLVRYHVHDALHHKLEMSHGRARMILKKTRTGGRCGDAAGDLCHRWTVTVFTNRIFGDVGR